MGGNLSICGGGCSLERCIAAGATEGEAFSIESDASTVELSCCDLWNNAGGDWIGPIADQLGHDGNTCQDPMFCDPEALDLTLAVGSPCAPDAVPGCGLIGAWPVACDWPTAAPERSPRSVPALLPNAPNPFNPATTIAFELPVAAPVRLSVHALDGRLVARLADGARPAGSHRIVWHGRDDAGRSVPSGTYLYRLEVGRWSEAQRLTLIR